METTLVTPQNIMFVIGLMGIVFTIYNYFKNPQIKTDQETISLKSEITVLKGEIKEIKETHLRTLEGEIKNLNSSVNQLSGTVIKLATIIDERIPKGYSALTPPGH